MLINDGKELIVPVLKDADRLSLLGLAQGANELAEKAREKELDFDDITGGSFTITNVGVFGTCPAPRSSTSRRWPSWVRA